MPIEYRDTKEFDAEELQDLFMSVQWNSGNLPEKLQLAMLNSHSVVSAWDGRRLVGLMNCISDGAMAAYFHYLLVRPEYQSQGIGKMLVDKMLERYEGVTTKILIAYNKQVGFYENCGFAAGTESTPMFVTSIIL